MQIDLGSKIRALRRKNGQTQESLAEALGVTPQAVSRWESGGSYPDINLIPAIANFFDITIDDLVGYGGKRTLKSEQLMDEIYELLSHNKGKDVNIDRCLSMARNALAEFPGNEKIMLCLASVLYKAGGVRYGEHYKTDADGYSLYDTECHQEYPEWNEAVKLYEKALPALEPGALYNKAIDELSQLYVNMGYHTKALALAESAPDILGTREFLRIYACDGKQRAAAYGEALVSFVQASAALILNATLANGSNLSSAEKVESIRNAIKLHDMVFVDGNYGPQSAFLADVHMLLSAFLWLDRKQDEAFDALNLALLHAKDFENHCKKSESFYTAPLLRLVQMNIDTGIEHARALTSDMPEDWPWWDIPGQERIKSEMQADPRWNTWATNTQQ